MTAHPELESYLTARSAQIDLPPGDLGRVTRRARTRRRRRRAAGGGLAAVVVLLAGVAVIAGRVDPAEPVTNLAGPAVVPSGLEWTAVPSRDGLGWSTPVVAEDGTVYALSTAADPAPGQLPSRERALYRSPDGAEWEAVGLPDGLSATGVATDGGALYALGTTAAGGSAVSLDLATSTDGGQAWDASEVPFDPAAEAPGFPGEVRVVGGEVAVAGGQTVVAVYVYGQVDVAEVMGSEAEADWYPTPTGMERVALCEPVEGSGEAQVVPPAAEVEAEDCPADAQEHRSWEELGVDPIAGDLVAGYSVVLAGPTGGELRRVGTPGGARFETGGRQHLVVADDGFWLVGQRPGSGDGPGAAVAWRSVDGASWAPVDVPDAGSILGTGVVDGRPVAVSVVMDGEATSTRLHLLGGGGTVTVDVGDLLEDDTGQVHPSAWGTGPMGLALVVQGPGPARVVTSPDGVAYSVQEIPLDEMAGPGQRANPNGVTVTADAIKVRVNVRSADDLSGGRPDAQHLYVGTPG